MNEAPSTPSGTTPPDASTPPGTPGSGNFFDWIRGTGVIRTDDAWLGGVAGGIARHTRLDPMIIRGIFLVVALLGGPALLVYAIGWALLPDSSGRIHAERAIKGVFDPAVVAIIVLVVLSFMPFMQGIWWQGAPDIWNMPGWLESTLSTGWTLAIIAAVIWLIVAVARRSSTGPTGGQGAGQAPRSHADYWTSPASASFSGTAAPADMPADRAADAPQHTAPDATGSATATATTDAAADAPAPASFVPSGAPEPAPTAAGGSPWYATADAAHAGDDGTRVYGATWTPPRGPSPAEREAQRRERDAIRAQHRREHEERYRARQPGAAFVSIALGLALIVGVLGTIALGYTTLSDTAVLIGVGSALGVIALATIISGIRGRESGALGFFAIVAILVLLFVGVFPRGTAVSVVGNTTWDVTDAAPGTSTGFSMAAGSPTLDLSALDDRGAEVGGVVELWLGAGTVQVVLPEDAPVLLEVAGGVAGVSYVDDGGLHERGSPLYREVLRFGNTSDDDTTTVRIWIGAGSVDVVNISRSAR